MALSTKVIFRALFLSFLTGTSAFSLSKATQPTSRWGRVIEFQSKSVASGVGVANYVSIGSAPRMMVSAGSDVLDKPAVEKKKDPVKEKKRSESKGWAVRLYNDPMNKREFVARCLMEICGLPDTAAYQIMMQAHQQGIAIVGRYHQERAELYRNKLLEYGLLSDMIPVDDDK